MRERLVNGEPNAHCGNAGSREPAIFRFMQDRGEMLK
jgi:hypothetical protein